MESQEPIEAEYDDEGQSPPTENLPAILETKAIQPYYGIATVEITPEQSAKLAAPRDVADLDILPTGEIYLSQVHYRKTLNDTFGPGKWALLPRGQFVNHGNTLCREYALLVNGKFIAESVGEQDYHPDNARQSWATAAESVKSNALMRCCKDLGIASECWNRHFTEKFKAEHCVKVFAKNVKSGKTDALWRRRDAPPFGYPYEETGEVGQARKTPPSSCVPEGDPVYTEPQGSAPPPPKLPPKPKTASAPADQPTGPQPPINEDGWESLMAAPTMESRMAGTKPVWTIASRDTGKIQVWDHDLQERIVRSYAAGTRWFRFEVSIKKNGKYTNRNLRSFTPYIPKGEPSAPEDAEAEYDDEAPKDDSSLPF